MATVVGIRRDLLDSLLVADQVPVVAPLARDEEGVVCNVNADDAAAGHRRAASAPASWC